MENKGPIQGSIWLGRKGLHWALGELRKLKHSPSSRSGIFHFKRDGYRTLEFSCLSNRGGCFVELSEYHGGTQHGSIRIPEGRRGEGWARFVTETHNYYLEKSDSGMAQPQRDGNSRPGRGSETQSRNDMKSRQLRGGNVQIAHKIQTRDSRDFSNPKEVNNRVILSTSEPRPTRLFKFEWKVGCNTIRISKVEGQARNVAWVESPKRDGPSKISGPEVGPSGGCESDLILARETEPLAKPNLEDLEDGEIDGEEIGVGHDTGVPSVEVPIPITPMVDAFEEPGCAEVVMPEPSFVTDLDLVRVDLASEFPATDHVIEAESPMIHEEPDSQLSVMEHHSQTVMTQCEAEPSAPLTCEPLAVVAPPNVSVAPRKPHSLDRSTWVNTQYKGICELMGFPLESHEQQCLALLRRIEAARFIKKGEVGSRKMVVSGTKGARELRNLVSSVNYEGRQRVSC
jgi:hypothetical protein